MEETIKKFTDKIVTIIEDNEIKATKSKRENENVTDGLKKELVNLKQLAKDESVSQ